MQQIYIQGTNNQGKQQ